MSHRFSRDELAAYKVADVLDRFGVPHSRSRAACPLCQTANTQAFSFAGGDGRLWTCFACGEGDDAIQLYARLAGIRPGRAIAEIASHLGLIASAAADWDAKRRAREQAAKDAVTAADIERTRWQARVTRRDRLRKAIAAVSAHGCTPLTWDILGGLYARLERVEAWLDQVKYGPKDWTPSV